MKETFAAKSCRERPLSTVAVAKIAITLIGRVLSVIACSQQLVVGASPVRCANMTEAYREDIMAKASELPKGHVHPYARWEGTPLWGAIEKSIADLVRNQDLIEKEYREYIVGYICKIVERRKTTIVAQLRRAAL